ncbi:MAG TPA: hypothetical protein PL155_04170 [Candidatus Omnitrophota bacterium]|nr:hypothetical protein [Candidatus Omnitrophota bacterium]HPD84329.1 hypothetical protein [Candidatus Omnitrophota bacterium]HRZ03187.1 hypothetical protein [Candidatus Omnitrophota bacterium]
MHSFVKEKISDYAFVVYSSAASLLLAFQVLVASVIIFHFIPIAYDLKSLYLDIYIGNLYVNRKILFYRIFICSAVFIQLLQFFIFRSRAASPDFIKNLKAFVIAEGILTGLFIYGYFLFTVDDRLFLPKIILAACALLMVVNKICVFLISDFIKRFSGWLTGTQRIFLSLKGPDIFAALFIILALYIPDTTGLKSAIYAGDHFYHIDVFVMGPGWASLKGLIPNVDTYSQYGTIMPILLSRLSLILGGFSYENILKVMMGMGIIYYLVLYFFLKSSLRSSIVAIIGILWLFKLQVFHLDTSLYLYPGRTVVRFFFDVPFFIFLLSHLRTEKRGWLFAMAAISGFAVSYVTDTGAYLVVCFYIYLLLVMAQPHCRRDFIKSKKGLFVFGVLCVLPAVVYFTFLWSSVGSAVFHSAYWNNLLGFVKQANTGFGAMPFMQLFKKGQMGAFTISVMMPLCYLATFLICAGFYLQRTSRKEFILPVVMSVYGLCLYQYYVWSSVEFNYLIYCVPFIFVLCYWFVLVLDGQPDERARPVALTVLGVSLLALLATPSFLKCPNIFNFEKKDYVLSKRVYGKTFDIETDANFVKQLTRPDEEACLISSFDVALLMRAERKPFFTRFPFIKSSFFQSEDFQGPASQLKEDYENALIKLSTEKPPYVFVEKKILIDYWTNRKQLWFPELEYFLRLNYTLGPESKHLVALKRNLP